MDTTALLTSQGIEERHPQWRVWESDTGTWWAAVSGRWTLVQERHGCMPHLHSESAERLEAAIVKQEACVHYPKPTDQS